MIRDVRSVVEFERLQRHSLDADASFFSAFARSFNIVPPSTPVANTYNQPLLKSNKCECTVEDRMFSSTATRPSQATVLGPVNNARCAIHIAHSTMAPTSPS